MSEYFFIQKPHAAVREKIYETLPHVVYMFSNILCFIQHACIRGAAGQLHPDGDVEFSP